MTHPRNISAVLAFITPGVIDLLMKNRGLGILDASTALYNSRLYQLLEDDETKLWRLSYTVLYDMLVEELDTGEITFPEEQL